MAARSASRRPVNAIPVAHGSIVNACGKTWAGQAIWTRPTPPRNAARAHSAGAPIMAAHPPTTITVPNVPLWPSLGRGGGAGMSCDWIMAAPCRVVSRFL